MKRSNILTIAAVAALGVTLAGCQFAPPKPQLTPLQIQTMQTQTFHASKAKTFNAVMNALSNMGYRIQNSNMGGGYINATGQAHSQEQLSGGFKWHGIDICTSDSNCSKNQKQVTVTVSGSATINQLGAERTSVRLNFSNSKVTSGHMGQTYQNDQQVVDPNFYQNIFSHIRQSLFVGQATTNS